jgi:multiple sugar transport system permease protein
MMVPWQVILVPQFVIVAKFGWVNTFQGLIVPFFAQVSVGTFFFRQFFLAIPQDLYDAAVVDGAPVPRIFFQIYIPLAKPAILAFSVLTGLSAWNNLIWPLVVTNTQSMKVITVALQTLTGKHVPTPVGAIMASSFISIIPILIIYIIAQRKFVEGVATVGLKY